MNSYAYFDGVLQSELPLPELLPGHSSQASFGIEILFGGPPKSLQPALLHRWIDEEGEVELELLGCQNLLQLTLNLNLFMSLLELKTLEL